MPIFILIIVGIFTRFFNLNNLFYGFHNDEVLNGYIGRYILENGFDVYGNKWPILYFNTFGDYPNVIPMYLSGFFTYIFGLNPFAVRFPIALFGFMTIFLVYYLNKKIFVDKKVAFVSALTLAVMPWHLVLSRSTAEGITASFVFLVAVIFLILSEQKNKLKYLFFSMILSVFTYLLYPSFRIFIPLAFLPSFLLFENKLFKKLLIGFVVITFGLTFLISQTTWGRGRYEQTSLFTHNNTIIGRAQNYPMALGANRVFEARLHHNKYILAGREFLRQYSSYFSPEYLVGTTSRPLRYLVPEHGLLYWSIFILPLAVLVWQFFHPTSKAEILALFEPKMNKFFVWFLWLILVVPIPASLTLDDVPNMHRTALMSVLLSLIIGFFIAVIQKIQYKKIKFLTAVFVLFLVLEFIHFWHYYANLSASATTLYRSDADRELAKVLKENQDKYEKIFVTGRGSMLTYYFFQNGNFDPSLPQQIKLGLEFEKYGNFYFQGLNCNTKNPNLATLSSTLVIDRTECLIPDNYREIQVIQNQDLTDAYRLLISTASAEIH